MGVAITFQPPTTVPDSFKVSEKKMMVTSMAVVTTRMSMVRMAGKDLEVNSDMRGSGCRDISARQVKHLVT
jgi:hypothetical protein